MPGAKDQEETSAVYLLGFSRDPEQATERLAQMFRLDEATAANLVRSVPVAVKRNATRETALAIAEGLRAIGADVEVRSEAGTSPSTAPPAVGMHRPGVRRAAVVAQAPVREAQAVVTAPAPEQRDAPRGDSTAFWSRLPVALVVPFLGSGVLWLVLLTVMLVILGLSTMVPCFSIILMPLTAAVYLGLMGIYFGQAAQVGLEDDGASPAPRWTVPAQQDVLFHGGALLLMCLLLFGLPAALAYKDAPNAIVYAAGLVPYVYWPMALTVSGITGSITALYNPIDIIKGIIAGGFRYVAVVLFGFLAYAGLSLLPALASTVSAGAVMGSLAVVAVGVGYIAGVQAFLMGRLVSSRSDEFERVFPGVV